ncbi:MAG: hypothetical protein HY720_16840 [Planctomycetes bacterium]|nr:hypothetical protein [Planctomycetota bacterium]
MRQFGTLLRLPFIVALFSMPLAGLFAQDAGRAREILIETLDLTPGQTELLVSTIGEAREAASEFDEYEAKELQAVEESYRELLAVVELDQEIPDEVSGKAGGAEHRWIDARRKLSERLNVLEEKLATALDERQLQLVSTFDADCAEDWAENVHERDLTIQHLGEDLAKLPRLSADQYERAREKLVAEIRRICCLVKDDGKNDGKKAGKKEGKRDELTDAMDQDIEWALAAYLGKIRRGPPPAGEAEEKRLAEGALKAAREAFLASAPLENARRRELEEEMNSIHHHRYGSTGPLAEHLLDPALLPLLDRSRQAPPSLDPTLARRKESIQDLGGSINLYNLMNGLHLSRPQVKGLLQLNVYRKGVHKGATDPKIDRTLSLLLTDSQENVIRDYQPCLIPPSNLTDPVRVGQAHDSSEASKFLDSVREISDAEYRAAADAIVEGAIKKAERANGPMEPDVRNEVATRLRQAIDRARALDDLDYVFQRSEIVAEIEAANRKETVKDEIERLAEELGEKSGPSKAATFLLTDSIVSLLQRRLALMNERKVPCRIDLEKIEGAESCKDGCALK